MHKQRLKKHNEVLMLVRILLNRNKNFREHILEYTARYCSLASIFLGILKYQYRGIGIEIFVSISAHR